MAHELMQFFAYEHLPSHLQEVSHPFCDVAKAIDALEPGELEGPAYSLIRDLGVRYERNSPCNCESTWASVKIAEARDAVAQGAGKGDVLRKLLEAKDCAVRAVLFKPCA